jgi:hypothetical protein
MKVNGKTRIEDAANHPQEEETTWQMERIFEA